MGAALKQRTGIHAFQTLLVLAAVTMPAFVGPYWVHVGTLAWYYALLAASWAMLAGYAGQFSFAHTAFAALGGYACALLVQRAGLPIVLGFGASVALSAVVGALLGWLVLRLSGPYLALFTLAIGEIFHLLLVAEQELTRGSLGLPVSGLFSGDSDVPYYYLGLGLVLAGLVAMSWILRTRVGLFLRAIREDEGAAQASGVNTTFYKILVFTITSVAASIAGVFYAYFVGILTPTMTILSQMGLVIAMAVIGGIESLPGAAIGAVVVYVLSELFRSYGELRFAFLGLALILVQRFAQNGLYPVVESLLSMRLRRPDSGATSGAVEKERQVVGTNDVD